MTSASLPRFLRSCCRGCVTVGVAAAACAPAPVANTNKTSPDGAGMSRAIIEPYLKIQTSLANDTADGVSAHAGTIAAAATALGAPATTIDAAALHLAEVAKAAPPDLAAVRDKFGALSEAIDTYMTGLKLGPPAGVKIAFCPMVRRPWLQEGETLANPYYGKAMPTCGSFR